MVRAACRRFMLPAPLSRWAIDTATPVRSPAPAGAGNSMPVNNASEQALRPSVIFRKVTNGFRSLWGADVHALIRSVISTGRLNGLSAHQAISRALVGQPIFA